MPTYKDSLTGKQIIENISAELNVEQKCRVIFEIMMKLMGIVMPVLKESVEMIYQYNSDYVFDSSKFKKAFKFKTTSYEEGIKQISQNDYR